MLYNTYIHLFSQENIKKDGRLPTKEKNGKERRNPMKKSHRFAVSLLLLFFSYLSQFYILLLNFWYVYCTYYAQHIQQF